MASKTDAEIDGMIDVVGDLALAEGEHPIMPEITDEQEPTTTADLPGGLPGLQQNAGMAVVATGNTNPTPLPVPPSSALPAVPTNQEAAIPKQPASAGGAVQQMAPPSVATLPGLTPPAPPAAGAAPALVAPSVETHDHDDGDEEDDFDVEACYALDDGQPIAPMVSAGAPTPNTSSAAGTTATPQVPQAQQNQQVTHQPAQASIPPAPPAPPTSAPGAPVAPPPPPVPQSAAPAPTPPPPAAAPAQQPVAPGQVPPMPGSTTLPPLGQLQGDDELRVGQDVIDWIKARVQDKFVEIGVAVMQNPSLAQAGNILHEAIRVMRWDSQNLPQTDINKLLQYQSVLSIHQVYVAAEESRWSAEHVALGKEFERMMLIKRGSYKAETVKHQEIKCCAAEPHMRQLLNKLIYAQMMSAALEKQGERFAQLENGIKRTIDNALEEKRKTVKSL